MASSPWTNATIRCRSNPLRSAPDSLSVLKRVVFSNLRNILVCPAFSRRANRNGAGLRRELMTAAALPSSTMPQTGKESEHSNHSSKIRTLIVDDQLMARELLRRLLKDETDIEIIGMPTSGREAVRAIDSLAPDLVFLDV